MAKGPSRKQLDFLEQLGYRGIAPETMTEASIVIDAMLETKDTKAAAASLKAFRNNQPGRKRSSCLGCLLMILIGIVGSVYYIGTREQRPVRDQRESLQPGEGKSNDIPTIKLDR